MNLQLFIQMLQKKCVLFTASVLSNLSQVTEAREFLSDVTKLNSLLPYITCTDNVLRKRGVVALLRNICFDSTRHIQLLEDFTILPQILLPLAGPEEMSDDDNDKLPIELQVLNSNIKFLCFFIIPFFYL